MEQPGRLLVVDDDENVLRSMVRVLHPGNWEITTAPDAESALSDVERLSPEVVISDFRLPGMNGIEFLTEVKQRAPRTQRIMLTGQADHYAVEDAINRSEVFRFISKPWNNAQLLLTVKSAFEQHQLVAENARLQEVTHSQNAELRQVNCALEDRVRRRTEALVRSKEEWERTFDVIDHPLAVVQPSGFIIRRANLAYARAAGRRIHDLAQPQRCHRFLFGREEPCVACPLGRSASSEQPSTAEVVHGQRVYILSVYPAREDDAVVCSYREVTQERAALRRGIETEKMAAVGSLAGGVAHEINNPLGGILAFAQLMKRDKERSSQDLEMLSLIEDSALRCKRIVDSLLKFSRRSGDNEQRPMDLSKCVEDALVLFRAQLKNHPHVLLDGAPSQPLPEVFGDSGRLAQVVLNLLQNGLQALPEGRGKLSVSTGVEGGRCFFRVVDDGVGIPPEQLSRIFEPHFTTKPPGEGTGLGLAIAYRIVQDHGGQFEVTSTVGQGSTFTVFMPTTPGSAP